jgi:replicative DNA helicase
MMETMYPYNEEVETSVIGAVIINPDIYIELALEEKHFYIHKNKYIWAAIKEMVDNKIPIDFVSLKNQLTENGKLVDVGLGYLVSIINTIPNSMHAAHYADILKKYFIRRRILETASTLAQYAQREDIATDELMLTVNDQFADLQSMRDRAKPISHVSEIIRSVYKDIETAYDNPSSIWGMPTGYEDFDLMLGGIQEGELLYFIGSPGAGKSILTLNLSLGLLSNNYPGAIFSYEMSNKLVTMRALSAMSEVSTRKMKTGKLDPEDWSDITKSYERLAQVPLYITDEMMTLPELHADIKYLKSQHNIKWVLIDYLWLLQGYENLKETERSGMLSAGIKRIIKTENVAGLVINAVTKSEYAMGGTPGLADMRGSSLVGHDADIVAHVKRLDDNKTLRLYFTKLRDVSRVEGKAIDFEAEVAYPKVRIPRKPGSISNIVKEM